ncbi:MAG: hypothetical protein ABS944_16215 [Solibacillus sp.]
MSKTEREEIITVLMMRRNYSLEFLDGCTDEVLQEMFEREA